MYTTWVYEYGDYLIKIVNNKVFYVSVDDEIIWQKKGIYFTPLRVKVNLPKGEEMTIYLDGIFKMDCEVHINGRYIVPIKIERPANSWR